MIAIDEKQLKEDLRRLFHSRGPGGAQLLDFICESLDDDPIALAAIQRLLMLSRD